MPTRDSESAEDDHRDPLIPVDKHGNTIVYPDNPAYIEGTLLTIEEFWIDRGLFTDLIEHHAVSLSNGKTAINHPSTIPFINKTSPDIIVRSVLKPAPSGEARVAEYNTERERLTTEGEHLTETGINTPRRNIIAADAIGEDDKTQYIVAPHTINKQ